MWQAYKSAMLIEYYGRRTKKMLMVLMSALKISETIARRVVDRDKCSERMPSS